VRKINGADKPVVIKITLFLAFIHSCSGR